MGESTGRGSVPPLMDKGKSTTVRKGSNLPLGMRGEGMRRIIKPHTQSGKPQRLVQCLPKAKTILKLQIRPERVGEDTQYMKYHAHIGKFVGIWPVEKTLVWWINTTWKPQGHYDLQLSTKGFFTIIFSNEANKTRIFKGGPYFFNSTCLYLWLWKESFNPDKENLSVDLPILFTIGVLERGNIDRS